MLSEKLKHSPTRGVLIAIEGIDGAGKTTQAQRLLRALGEKGIDAVVIKEPTMGKWGHKIALLGKNGRTLSAQDEFRYFLEDRKEDVAENIRPALKQNKVIIMDRYYYSSIAYQGAKGMSPSLVEQENLTIAPKPDIVILLDITSKEAKRRIEHYRNGTTNHFEQRLDPVRKVFREIAKTHPEVKLVDGEKPESEVHSEILSEVLSLVSPLLKEYEE